MAENSGISWTDHTFNPWIGCTKISAACDHCYAETLATQRLGVQWGPHAERRLTKPSTWNMPRRWNRQAEREGRRFRVFCASLADVFDNQAPEEWRAGLWQIIHDTPHLDWLLLTKRPQNVRKMLPDPAVGQHPAWGDGWANVWLGTTVESQREADLRIPHLLDVPAAVRFLSMEPLLEAVDLTDVRTTAAGERAHINALTGEVFYPGSTLRCGLTPKAKVDWVIVGGESGPHARPFSIEQASKIAWDCTRAGTAFWMKQLGHQPLLHGKPYPCTGKGEKHHEWPIHLWRQELPGARA
jgi:protein gp37